MVLHNADVRSRSNTQANASACAGNKRSVKMETDDIAAGLDDLRYTGYGDADDDVDFM